MQQTTQHNYSKTNTHTQKKNRKEKKRAARRSAEAMNIEWDLPADSVTVDAFTGDYSWGPIYRGLLRPPPKPATHNSPPNQPYDNQSASLRVHLHQIPVDLLAGGDAVLASIQELRRDLQALRFATHPHITRFYGLWGNEGRVYAVTEMTGTTLREFLSRGRDGPWGGLSLERWIRWALQIADAMAYLHNPSVRLEHGDLTTSCIYVADEGTIGPPPTAGVIKVGMWGGLSSRINHWLQPMRDHSASTGTSLHGIAFYPPELTMEDLTRSTGNRELGDVYSFTIVMWEMLCGRVALHGISPTNIATFVAAKIRPPLPLNLPDVIRNIFSIAWHQDPYARPNFYHLVTVLNRLRVQPSWRVVINDIFYDYAAERAQNSSSSGLEDDTSPTENEAALPLAKDLLDLSNDLDIDLATVEPLDLPEEPQRSSNIKPSNPLSALAPFLNPADSRLIGMDESGFLADIVDYAAIQNVHLSQPYAELLVKSQMSIFRMEHHGRASSEMTFNVEEKLSPTDLYRLGISEDDVMTAKVKTVLDSREVSTENYIYKSLRKICDISHHEALIYSAIYSFYGIGTEKNSSSALNDFVQAAHHPSPSVIFQVDLFHSFGKNFQDGGTAHADRNFLRAQCLYILCLIKKPRFIPSLVALRCLYLEYPSDIPFPRGNNILYELADQIETCPTRKEDTACRFLQKLSWSHPIFGYFLGICHLFGYGADRNIGEGVRRLRDAAEAGVVGAMYHYGMSFCHQRVEESKRDYLRGLDWLMKASNGGHTQAMNNVGCCFLRGYGFKADPGKALEWWKISSHQGGYEAMYLCGLYYLRNWGREPDDTRKESKSKNIAEQTEYVNSKAGTPSPGSPVTSKSASPDIATSSISDENQELKNGDEVDSAIHKKTAKDPLESETPRKKRIHTAGTWLARAARRGHPKAQRLLGMNLVNLGQYEYELELAADYLKKASLQCDKYSSIALGMLYCSRRIPSSIQTGYKWLLQSASINCPQAQFIVGVCNLKGLMGPLNISDALYWITLSAKNNYPWAQYVLGWMYADGVGFGGEKNLKSAAAWTLKAARNGLRCAQADIGDSFFYGIGISQSLREAMGWYNLAQAQGHSHAKFSLALCYLRGYHLESSLDVTVDNAPDIDESPSAFYINPKNCILGGKQGTAEETSLRAQCFSLLSSAANTNDRHACTVVGLAYYHGLGIERDYNHAFRYIQKALYKTSADAEGKPKNIYRDLFKANHRLGHQNSNQHNTVANTNTHIPSMLHSAFDELDASFQNNTTKTPNQKVLSISFAGGQTSQIVVQVSDSERDESKDTGVSSFSSPFHVEMESTCVCPCCHRIIDPSKAQEHSIHHAKSKSIELENRTFATTNTDSNLKDETVGDSSKEIIEEEDTTSGDCDDEHEHEQGEEEDDEIEIVDEAVYTLGLLYENGLGVQKNMETAVQYFLRAASYGHADAMFRLAECYRHGRGIPANEEEAFEWYTIAAHFGQVDAQVAMGEFLMNCGNPPSSVSGFSDLFSCAFASQYIDGPGPRCIIEDKAKSKRPLRDGADSEAKNPFSDSEYETDNDSDEESNSRYDYYYFDDEEYERYFNHKAEQFAPFTKTPVTEYLGLQSVQQRFKEKRYLAEQRLKKRCEIGLCKDFVIIDQDSACEAVQWFRIAADKGHGDAYFLLGDCYFQGLGVERDRKVAALWYKKAADMGHSGGQHGLGLCKQLGEGVEQDLLGARRLYEQAAAQGHTDSMHHLGLYHLGEENSDLDTVAGVEWLQKAASLGHAGSQCSLGDCYECGRGVPQNHRRAIYWYGQAAAQEHPLGLTTLAVRLMRAPAQDGADLHRDASHDLGMDEPTARDVTKACALLRRAAAVGVPEAHYRLGLCFLRGEGVPRDYKKAAAAFGQAANLGHIGARVQIGKCYEHGYGLNQDIRVAYNCYLHVAKQGDAEAQYLVGCFHYEGRVVAQDYAKAVDWFLQAKEDHVGCLYMLGLCHELGHGVQKDTELASIYYNRASAMGHSVAGSRLRGLAQAADDSEVRVEEQAENKKDVSSGVLADEDKSTQADGTVLD